ncbi:related to thermoresistant gluconokinase [Sporisorium reilianum f. sp. reilianum]|uniref:gluconokinase n=1 Tax=Sporisorium reilianum f. sp. reilianum TaxID=72559 RepID=A0A2N8UIF6_9BASI|nr:related to thermoresistant gluconokinase [Sporisorium reilianum f. sp. reilianum]
MTGGTPPTLLIVMGTSGSGKSTVGAALSGALHCPFVDGDDLHPASNVAKMSAGQPLDDADREPWLVKIRRTGLELATTQTQPQPQHGESGTCKMAEVLETSQAHSTARDHSAAAAASASESNTQSEASKERSAKVVVIACSSLKLVYRRLLRGTLPALNHPSALHPEPAPPTDLRVVHIYLDLSRQLLEQRMSNRKGHFMKLDMLYSQLDTLQVPDPKTEPGVIVVKVERETSTDAIVRDAVAQLRALRVV